MTGPRTPLLHPQYRRGRRLLPLAAAIMLGQLACSTDQATEPTSPIPTAAATGSHPRPKVGGSRLYSSSRAPYRVSPSFSSSSGGVALSMNGPSVLVLADTDVVSTTALATSLADAGLQVTLRPGPEWSWDGTNPSLSGFDVVVHLNGSTYDVPLPSSAQTALADFVSNGGGYVGAKWNGFEDQPQLVNLTLQGYGGDPMGPEQTCGFCDITYEAVAAAAGHPVLAGLPASFTFTADGHDAGPQIEFAGSPSTMLMQVPSGSPAVLVRELGAGRIVNFSFAPNYYWDDLGNVRDPVTLQDPTIQQLYLNSVQWAAGGSGTIQPQSITFEPLVDKVYGDPAFTLGATASSGLPVNYTSSGTCHVDGTRVALTGAGSCTITAHQPGNDQYEPADDVSQSFNIAKATASITLLNTVTTYSGSVKSVLAVTDPAELTVVSLSYSQGGSPIAAPVNAGSYQVLATLDNPNYQGETSGTLTINQATPAISWTPASITAGTALGAAQLNATARGIGGAILSGGYAYTPPAGTVFSAGPATLSVSFTPDSPNYTGASRSVSITVLSGMSFSGFYAPVRNMPMVNVLSAGSSIPIKFSVGGYLGLQILSGTPTSEQVQCPAGTLENSIRGGTTLARTGLTAQGYSYSYLWKTSPTWGGTCRKFVLTLRDGTTHELLFRFPGKAPLGAIGRRIIRR